MTRKRPVWVLIGLLLIGMTACAGPSGSGSAPPADPPPDPAVRLLMTEEQLKEANAAAVALGLRPDAVGFIDAGETGGFKTIYLRDFGITDPETRVYVECGGHNINGDPLPARGVVFNLVQGINSDGLPLVALDGTPIIRFEFQGGWHEICGIYVVEPDAPELKQQARWDGPPLPAPPPESSDDLIAYFDIGESGGGKRLFLRDFDLTDPAVRVTIQCTGININGDMLPGPGLVENLVQGTSRTGHAMVDGDGTPFIRYDFTGGWHEVCGLYHYDTVAEE